MKSSKKSNRGWKDRFKSKKSAKWFNNRILSVGSNKTLPFPQEDDDNDNQVRYSDVPHSPQDTCQTTFNVSGQFLLQHHQKLKIQHLHLLDYQSSGTVQKSRQLLFLDCCCDSVEFTRASSLTLHLSSSSGLCHHHHHDQTGKK